MDCDIPHSIGSNPELIINQASFIYQFYISSIHLNALYVHDVHGWSPYEMTMKWRTNHPPTKVDRTLRCWRWTAGVKGASLTGFFKDPPWKPRVFRWLKPPNGGKNWGCPTEATGGKWRCQPTSTGHKFRISWDISTALSSIGSTMPWSIFNGIHSNKTWFWESCCFSRWHDLQYPPCLDKPLKCRIQGCTMADVSI